MQGEAILSERSLGSLAFGPPPHLPQPPGKTRRLGAMGRVEVMAALVNLRRERTTWKVDLDRSYRVLDVDRDRDDDD